MVSTVVWPCARHVQIPASSVFAVIPVLPTVVFVHGYIFLRRGNNYTFRKEENHMPDMIRKRRITSDLIVGRFVRFYFLALPSITSTGRYWEY